MLSALAAACAPQEYHAQTPSVYRSAASCITSNQDNLYTTGGYAIRYLTVGTGDPARSPWWEGGTTEEHPEWTLNDPYLGEGFEGAVTFEVAERLGFSDDAVRFVPVDFDESYAPGEKDFDFVLQQIASLPQRNGVDFSEGYYEVELALVSVRASPISGARSLQELKDATVGAPAGTTGLEYIQDTIRPNTRPAVFDDLGEAIRAVRSRRVDGLVVDLPTANVVTEAQLPDGVVVGRLPAAGPLGQFAMAFEKGSPIVECVDLALEEMKQDGTLDEIGREWLGGGADVPLIDG